MAGRSRLLRAIRRLPVVRQTRRQFAKCLHPSVKATMVLSMNRLQGRMVVVNAEQLDDLLELARLAVHRLDPNDQLTRSLASAVSEVRVSSVIEP